MTYSERYAYGGLVVYKKGHSYRETCRVFDISLSSLQRWLKAGSLERRIGFIRRRKIDAAALRRHVKDYPNMYLRERAEVFGVAVNSMHYALKRLGIVKKKRQALRRAMLYAKAKISRYAISHRINISLLI